MKNTAIRAKKNEKCVFLNEEMVIYLLCSCSRTLQWCLQRVVVMHSAQPSPAFPPGDAGLPPDTSPLAHTLHAISLSTVMLFFPLLFSCCDPSNVCSPCDGSVLGKDHRFSQHYPSAAGSEELRPYDFFFFYHNDFLSFKPDICRRRKACLQA